MKLLISFLILLSSAFAGDSFEGRVLRVVDGDSLEVETPDRVIKVRLFGVDSPEKDQEGGDEATRFTADAVLDRTVQIVNHSTDRYGRMVADVVLPDGRILNRELVGAGHAWWCPQYAPGDEDLARLEGLARQQRKGLWAAASPLPPWQWRKIRPLVSRSATRRTSRRSERVAAGVYTQPMGRE